MERLTEEWNGKYLADIYDEDYDGGLGHTIPLDNVKVELLIQKLGKNEDLEEQGLLLKLPCKNWMDIVFGEQEVFWGIDKSYIENPIREITVDNSDRFTWYDGWKTVVLKGYDENGFDWEFSPSDIGKTVFLTQAEAEDALQRMERES